MLGLWEIEYQNPEVQQYLLKFLKILVSDGLMVSAMMLLKHIELQNIRINMAVILECYLNNGSEFQYGEVLQDNISRDADYANLMSITSQYDTLFVKFSAIEMPMLGILEITERELIHQNWFFG